MNARTNNGTTALGDCGYWGDYCILEALIVAHSDVNAKDDLGWTPLITAAYHGKSDCVRALIAAGADVDAKDRDGDTALSMTKEGNFAATAAILRSAGAKE